jgi:putative flippase GtrA
MERDTRSPDDQQFGETSRFLRFSAVGGVGFVVDAGVLLALVHALGMNPIVARMFSFSIAVLVTFELNRTWSFGSIRLHRPLMAFLTYLGVQGAGFLCNLAVYTAAIFALPPPFNAPLLCLAVASAAGLLVNYTGARHLLFGADGRGGAE